MADKNDREEEFHRQILAAKAGTRPYLSTKAAAWHLGMHHSMLSRLHQRGAGPPAVVRDPSRRANAPKFYAISDLDAWIESRKVLSAHDRHQMAILDDLSRQKHDLQCKAEVARVRASVARIRGRLSGDS
jgi:hypothetical protein